VYIKEKIISRKVLSLTNVNYSDHVKIVIPERGMTLR